MRDRAHRWNKDAEIQALLGEIGVTGAAPRGVLGLSAYSSSHRDSLLDTAFDRVALAGKRLAYERLDQLTMEVLLGVR